MTRFLSLIALLSAFSVQAYEARFTRGQIAPELSVLLAQATQDTGVTFDPATFILAEERDLATSHFRMWVQAVGGIPVGGTAVRVWSQGTETIQAELHLNEQTQLASGRLTNKMKKAGFSKRALASGQLARLINRIATQRVSKHATDARVLGIKSRDEWSNGDLVRVVEVRGRRGIHTITVSLTLARVLKTEYKGFSPVDANVYPIYEEVEGTGGVQLPTVRAELKHLAASAPVAGNDPLAAMRSRQYFEAQYNPVFAQTSMGRQRGYWSMESVRAEAEQVLAALPSAANDFTNGLRLRGKFVNINIHPDARAAFPGVNFALAPAASYLANWKRTNNQWELVPAVGLAGRAFTAESDISTLLPERLANHDATAYINSGFDEVQVYYGVTTLMEALVEMGMTDPEYSTKAFEAFLFDPDIGMRDNAYYTDNTINFTTYSPAAGNAARDNSTIWHELGHAVMDRLMGPFLRLADTGGLSEGMADFVAMLVVQHQTNNQPFPGREKFRIINKTNFFMTNEVHDDGEAYGGAMNDILDAAIVTAGRQGVFDIADLTIEAMRLTRNHPGLNAQEWYSHMLYADELGGRNRAPGAYRALILSALGDRNFSFDTAAVKADLLVEFDGRLLDDTNPASRENPLPACDLSGTAHFDLKVSVRDGETFAFNYPVKVEVEFKTHALQGAIRWAQEAQNPNVFTINGPRDFINLPLDASMECDEINQPDGTCKDYAYIQVTSHGEAKPRAKKRFYLKIKPNPTACPTVR
jgi:hypothetical protein